MTTSDAADKVEYSASKGAVSLGNQGAQKRKREGWFLKGVKLVKLDWVTKKGVARYMTRDATDVESGFKDCLQQRPNVSESKVER